MSKDDKIFSFTDLGAMPDTVHRLVEAILDGDAETAIDLLCEDFPQLDNYQHQKRRHDMLRAGRNAPIQAAGPFPRTLPEARPTDGSGPARSEPAGDSVRAFA